MKKLFKYLFVFICSVLFFVSCSNNGFIESDEVFLTINVYNNLDDSISQFSCTKQMTKDESHVELSLDRFGFDPNKEGYIFFGGYSE